MRRTGRGDHNGRVARHPGDRSDRRDPPILDLHTWRPGLPVAIDIRVVSDEETRQRVFRFRYDVHVDELGKGGPGVCHETRTIHDQADEVCTLLVAVEEDRIVGTGRICHGSLAALPDQYREWFSTAGAEAVAGANRISVTSRLMVDPSYRGRTLASLLVMRIYDWAIKQGTDLDFCMAETPLLRMYYRLGYRTYKPAIRPGTDAIRVPLVLSLRDRAHLVKCDSPFAMLLPESLDDGGRNAKRLEAAYPEFASDAPVLKGDLRTLWARYADGLTRRARRGLLDGLDEAQVDHVLGRAAALPFARDELVRGRAEGGALGVVLSGRLGVGVPRDGGWHWVEILSPGDVFGDLEPLCGERHVELVALEPTQTALLSQNLVEKLSRTDASLAMRLSMNLVAVLRQRVDDLHRRGAAFHRAGRDLTPAPFNKVAQ